MGVHDSCVCSISSEPDFELSLSVQFYHNLCLVFEMKGLIKKYINKKERE